MALSEPQKELIIRKAGGDVDQSTGVPTAGAGLLAAYIEAIWDSYEGHDALFQELYTLRDCLDLVIGVATNSVDTTVGPLAIKSSQRVANLRSIKDAVLARMSNAANSGIPAFGLIERETLVDDPTMFLNDII